MTAPAASSTADAAKGGDISLSTKLFHGFGSVAYGVKDGGFRSSLLLVIAGMRRRKAAGGVEVA